MSDRHLLIIEDDPGLQSQMRWCFDDIEVSTAQNAQEVQGIIEHQNPQVITLDLGLPPDPGGASVGFEVLEMLRTNLPRAKVVIVTGREDKENALRAIADGAYDFYNKPVDADTLKFVVERAFRLWELEDENDRLSEPQLGSMPLDGLITAAPSMLAVCKAVERVAPTDASVLILGETGTGKELIAQAIHDLGSHKSGPFVAINCAAIPETLLESELFGHEKGSFTGASARQKGKIESADGGTLFLDEIGDMPLALQAKILRFVQERKFERIGGQEAISVETRLVCATHRDLTQMIDSGEFREDLYFRISEIPLALPPLRARQGDPAMIAIAFLKRFAADQNLRLGSAAKQALDDWHWPGNIRELENRVKRACIMTDTPEITVVDLGLDSTSVTLNGVEDSEPSLNLKDIRDAAERRAILQALERTDTVSEAAKLLGVSRPTLYSLFAKHEIEHKG